MNSWKQITYEQNSENTENTNTQIANKEINSVNFPTNEGLGTKGFTSEFYQARINTTPQSLPRKTEEEGTLLISFSRGQHYPASENQTRT